MSNQLFRIIVFKHIIVKEKKNKVIKKNYFITIWSIVREALKNISTSKRIRYFSCGEYLVI